MVSKASVGSASAIFAAGYLKRWLERAVYDRLDETAVMQAVHELPLGSRYGIEAILNLVNAAFGSQLSGDTPFKHALRDVVLDAAPELSKRVINGKSEMRDAKVANVLLQLTESDLAEILDWIAAASTRQRGQIQKIVQNLDSDGLTKIARLNAAEREALLAASQAPHSATVSRRFARHLRLARESLKKGD